MSDQCPTLYAASDDVIWWVKPDTPTNKMDRCIDWVSCIDRDEWKWHCGWIEQVYISLNKINLIINLKDLYYNFVSVNTIPIDWIVFKYKDYVIIFDSLYSIKSSWLLNKFSFWLRRIKFDYQFKGLPHVLSIDLYHLTKNFVLFQYS